jgi:hypothetical protein
MYESEKTHEGDGQRQQPMRGNQRGSCVILVGAVLRDSAAPQQNSCSMLTATPWHAADWRGLIAVPSEGTVNQEGPQVRAVTGPAWNCSYAARCAAHWLLDVVTYSKAPALGHTASYARHQPVLIVQAGAGPHLSKASYSHSGNITSCISQALHAAAAIDYAFGSKQASLPVDLGCTGSCSTLGLCMDDTVPDQ